MKIPMNNVESRPLPPDFMFVTAMAIIPQSGRRSQNAAKYIARPKRHTLPVFARGGLQGFVYEPRGQQRLHYAVKAMVNENGRMARKHSIVNTCGSRAKICPTCSKLAETDPISPMVLTCTPDSRVNAVISRWPQTTPDLLQGLYPLLQQGNA